VSEEKGHTLTLEELSQIATIVTGIGILIAVWQLRDSKVQRVRQFEDFYIQRYWSLMDELSLSALKSMLSLANGAPTADFEDDDLRAAYSYLVLCEDEAELRRGGWISDVTWSLWRDYIASQLKRPPFDHAWNEIRLDREPGSPRPFEHLRALSAAHSEGRGYDPCSLRVSRRWLRGLR